MEKRWLASFLILASFSFAAFGSTQKAFANNIFVNDSFTGSTGTLLTNHTGEVGASWTQPTGNVGATAGNANPLKLDGNGGVYGDQLFQQGLAVASATSSIDDY